MDTLNMSDDPTTTYVIYVTSHENGEHWSGTIESVCSFINDAFNEYNLAMEVRPLSEVVSC